MATKENTMSYPKWIQRSPDIGPVLAADEEDEKHILAHWKKQEKEAAKRAEAEKIEPAGDGL